MVASQAEGPLQTYAGRLMERSGTGKYARYTHFNDVRCPWGGLAVEKETGKWGSNFCKPTVSVRCPSLPRLSAAFSLMCFVHRSMSNIVFSNIAIIASPHGYGLIDHVHATVMSVDV